MYVEFFPEPELPDDETLNFATKPITLDGTPNNLSEIVNPQYQWFKDGNIINGETNPT